MQGAANGGNPMQATPNGVVEDRGPRKTSCFFGAGRCRATQQINLCSLISLSTTFSCTLLQIAADRLDRQLISLHHKLISH